MSAESAVWVVLLGLVVGAAVIVSSVRLVHDRDAAVPPAAAVALVGAAVWGVFVAFDAPLSLAGFALAGVVWAVGVRWRYPGGWSSAIVVAAATWLAVGAVGYLLARAGVFSSAVFGPMTP